VTQVSRAGTASVAGAAGDAVNGNSVVNDGKVWLELGNTAGVSHTCTIAAAVPGADGLTLGSKVITIPASGSYRTDVWPPAIYGSVLQITVDNAAVTISPYRHS
jgi:hypothetical protein